MDKKELKLIENHIRSQIASLAKNEEVLGRSESKARLARLRRGIGKYPGELPELWSEFLKYLPEELMSKNEEISYAEWAIYTALTLFSLHQQGKSTPMHAEGNNFHLGCALGKLVSCKSSIGDDREEENIRVRLSIAANSDDMIELAYRLKSIIQLLGEIPLDYVDLTKDLYLFQFETCTDRIRLKWGRDFFRMIDKENKRKDDKNEKE